MACAPNSLFRKLSLLVAGLVLVGGATSCMEPGKGSGDTSKGAPTSVAYATNPVSYTIGVAIAANTPSAKGGTIKSWSIGASLPAGLAFDTTTGAITGAPTGLSGETDYTVTANNGNGSNYVRLRLAVVDVAPTMTYAGPTTFQYVVGTPIATITPALGGGATISCESTPALPAGISLSPACVMSGVPTAPADSRTYRITASNSGGSAGFTLTLDVNDVPPVVGYASSIWAFNRGIAISTRAPTNSGGPITSCTITPALPAGLSLSSGCILSGTPTALYGSTSHAITATNSGGSSTTPVTLSVVDLLPAIGYVGGPFAYTKDSPVSLTATNTGGAAAACSVTVGTLPAGLSIGTNCRISGTPTAATASTTYTVQASNTAGNATTTVTFEVKDIPPTLSYVGSPYTFTNQSAITTVTPATGGGTITACSSNPALPTGLSISSSTCAISGTPTAVTSSSSYVITASNSGGSVLKTISLRVKARAPVLTYAGSPYSWPRGVAITPATPTNAGDPTTSCTVTPALPAGLSLASTCVITGAPTVVTPVATYSVTGVNAEGSSTTTLSITVSDSPPILSYSASPYTFTNGSLITTLTPTNTGGSITSCAISPALPAGLSFNTTTCAISGTPTALQTVTSHTVTATNTGGNGTATISVTVVDQAPSIQYFASPYVYTISTAISTLSPTNTGGAIISCAISPAAPTGLSFSTTTCDITGTPTVLQAATAYTITATNTGGSSAKAIQIGVVAGVPTISYSPSSYTFTKSVAITTVAPTLGGGTVTSCASVPTLPAGLSLSSTCDVTGTPTAVAAAASYTVTATNTGGSASTILTLTANDALATISYAGSPFTWTKNSAITTLTPTLGGGAVTSCTSSPTLPAGLSLASTTCMISGTPTVVTAAADYTISAVNTGGTATTAIHVAVNDIVPTISYAGSPLTYVVGSAITTLSPTLGGGAVTSCTSSPALPSGLSLHATTCAITGTPLGPVASTGYTITAANSGGNDTATITILVNDIAPSLTYMDPFVFTKNTAISAKIPSNLGGAVISCSPSQALPAGLSLSSTCVITGKPTAATATDTYTLTGTNTGGSSSPTITITVNDMVAAIGFTMTTKTFVLREAISTWAPVSTGGAITACSPSPALPAGLSISNTTCAITGTPTAVTASAAYVVTATTSGGSSNDTVTIRVKNQPLVAYYGLSALDGSADGTAPSSSNVWKATRDGIDRATLTAISGSGRDSIEASWAPAGTHVTYGSTRALDGTGGGSGLAGFDVWRTTANAATSSALTQNTTLSRTSDRAPVYSPNGAKIAFAGKLSLDGAADGTPATSSYNIWIMNADGTVKTALTQNSNAGLSSEHPVWSPDGNYIYFQSLMSTSTTSSSWDLPASGASNIWKVNVSTGALTALTTESSAGRDCTEPMISPDGTKIAYVSRQNIGPTTASSSNIWRINSDGSVATAFTANTAASLDSKQPSWSPDGAEIAFASLMPVAAVTSSSYNIWKMSSSGASQTALTTNTAAGKDSLRPGFSPDSAYIAFESLQNVGASAASSYNIWVMQEAGTGQTPVTSNTSSGLDSHLAPVGIWYAE